MSIRDLSYRDLNAAREQAADVYDDCLANGVGPDEAIYAYEDAYKDACNVLLRARRS